MILTGLFYNFLLTTSAKLGEKFVELTSLTKPYTDDYLYEATKERYYDLITTAGLQVIISTATAINHSLDQGS